MRKTLLVLIVLALVAGFAAAEGMWRDGTYTAEGDAFDHGWKNFVRIIVENGYIAEVHFDAYAEGSGAKNKYLASVQGEYGMVANGGAQAAWWEQADRAAAQLMTTQDPTIFTRTPSEIDAISGVSIDVGAHFELAAQALQGARR